MAKGKSGRTGTRDTLVVASPRAALLPRSSLLAIDDRRTFDFEPASRPARLFTGSTAAITATPVAKKTGRASMRVPYQIAFSAPQETLVCVRRHRRKEVLHALKKTGKRGQRKPRRSTFSNTRC